MKVTDVLEHFQSVGIDHAKYRPDKVEKASQFFGYQFERDGTTHKIHVECTSRSLIEQFLCFPLHLQEEFWWFVTGKVPNPGDQELINTVENRRGGRVVRLGSSDPAIVNLLLTH